LKACVAGVQARTYGTEQRGEVPQTLDDFVNEALLRHLSQYEDIFNDGQEFPREHVRLSPGPVAGRPRQQ
jgi:hypothetical protein